ncbi:MAG: mannose-1-phosphate guanylyltransferase [Oceanospirillaceae bacterium]|nr:mannose-1-phosphate guanylyltransferase [Oceanospirillaceae bacterium]
MRAMILAAGLGTRMRPLTLKTPKPLLTVAGRALIDYQVERLVELGVDRIVVNHAWLGEQIESHLGDGSRWGCEILYSAEESALETAGGIRRALPLLADRLDDCFWVVNGDVFTDLTGSQMRGIGLSDNEQAHLLLVENPFWHPRGDFVLDPDGKVKAQGDRRLTFSGMSLLRASLFEALVPGNSAPLAPLLRTAIEQGRVAGTRLQGFWDDIGTPQRLAALESRMKGDELNVKG